MNWIIDRFQEHWWCYSKDSNNIYSIQKLSENCYEASISNKGSSIKIQKETYKDAVDWCENFEKLEKQQ